MTRFLKVIFCCAALSLLTAEAIANEPVHLDLQPYANQQLTDTLGRGGLEGNNLVTLPKGKQSFKGVKFEIADGFVQLGSKLLKEEKPDAVEAIKVGMKFSKLHLLHSTGFGNGSVIGEEGQEGDPLFVSDGTLIAEYKVRYDDGTIESIPVVYGKDVRDWWFTENSKGVSRGKVAWSGDNAATQQFDSHIRLYLTSWENPHPAKQVSTLDYVKVGDTPAAPFLIAATLEEQ